MISGAVGPGEHDLEASSIWLVSILGNEPRKLRGGAFRAVLSPDDSRIAYMSGDGDLWIADGDGGNPRVLVGRDGPEYYGSPAWSPDGKRIVYKRGRYARSVVDITIESRGIDDESPTVLVHVEPLPLDVAISSGLLWRKDLLMIGDRLVYVREEPPPRRRDQNLWELAIDPRTGRTRGAPRRLTDWAGFRVVDLSVTADGAGLVFLNDQAQADVWVGDLGQDGRTLLHEMRRLTMDDRDDQPTAWTPDSRAVVFDSNRGGTTDVLVQGLDERNARELAAGEGDQVDARLSPDRATFYYWESNGWDRPGRLLRVPVGGGPSDLVLERSGAPWISCASVADGPCLFFEHDDGFGIGVGRLDAKARAVDSVTTLDSETILERPFVLTSTRTALSPDGRRIATIDYKEPVILLLDAATGELVERIEITGIPAHDFSEIVWSSDGRGFYVIGETGRRYVLMHVDRGGATRVLEESQTSILFAACPSPDGRHLALGKTINDTNVWMVDGR